MDHEYKSILPAPVARLVDEIEAGAGIAIAVRRDPAIATEMRAVCGMKDGQRWGRVEYRGESIAATDCVYREPFGIFTHELLHLHRHLAAGVPAAVIQGETITATDPVTEQAVNGHSGTISSPFVVLEHLAMDTRLGSFGFRPPDYATPLRERWSNRTRYDHVGLELRDCMAAYLQTAIHAPDALPLAERAMTPEELEVGRRLARDIRRLLTSPDPVAAKEAMVLVFCGAAGIPPDSVLLTYYKTDLPGMAKWHGIPREIRVLRPDGGYATYRWRPKDAREGVRSESWVN